MEAKKKAKPVQTKPKQKAKTDSRFKIPEGLWVEAPRNGIYKLYHGKSVTIEGEEYTNKTKELVKLISGEEMPKLD